MKQNLTKTIVVVMALLGLLLMVADIPGEGIVWFAVIKVAGVSLFWWAARIFESRLANEDNQ